MRRLMRHFAGTIIGALLIWVTQAAPVPAGSCCGYVSSNRISPASETGGCCRDGCPCCCASEGLANEETVASSPCRCTCSLPSRNEKPLVNGRRPQISEPRQTAADLVARDEHSGLSAIHAAFADFRLGNEWNAPPLYLLHRVLRN